MKRGKKKAAHDFASYADQDREAAQNAYKRLSTLNGYAETFSLFPGEALVVRLARKPKSLLISRRTYLKRIEIRDAIKGIIVSTTKPEADREILQQEPASFHDDGAAYTCSVTLDTTSLPPGLYECVAHDSAGTKSQDIFFNVKPRSFEGYDLLCVLPTFTWHAYSRVGGGSFYSNSLGWKRTITTKRPMSRLGDNAIEAALAFLSVFAGDGVKYACIDSWDLHRSHLPEGPIAVMALLTHDEYWTAEMRAMIDGYLQYRGVLLIMAGNVCWWRIWADGDNITADKTPGPKCFHWYTHGEPEEQTFLMNYRFGGYAVDRAQQKPSIVSNVRDLSQTQIQEAGGIDIVLPGHPLFEGVVLGPGGSFGAEVPILYREVDGIPLKPDGSVDRDWYDADDVEPKIIATGLTVAKSRYLELDRAGVVAEAIIRRGFVLHMGSFGWSLGLVKKNEAVKRVVLNAYRYCRSRAGGKLR